MLLEHLTFYVNTAKVTKILSALYCWNTTSVNHHILIVGQFTAKAYAALLEGPFANSILETRLFEKEYYRLRHLVASTSNLDAMAAGAADEPRHSLELLGMLKDRMEENRRKFPWKSLFSSIRENESMD
jgi:hypothetical protein